ncbi:TetR/AcrR family transcriptional regulator [Litorivivens lipolytica]|uniref:Nucleoid occlusion factor SlmA n=1 Tax=Litorivivens lipolytica TaxID=1524264 RepID=A0A7W4W8E4_9GAMM|nr:nucleoid occlusion factor SlmA [Litorivivens lipolytica]MBB3048764.1 TetR/AcrR family transcriptional regulator [Litorivivens lipolytica]
MTKRSSRKQEILEALARMLEANPGDRITTAKLAEAVGVSEAALYRHFPSKAKMFEGLIEFVEESIFSRVQVITTEDSQALSRCYKVLSLLLVFTERNPGITRILNGDALAGETARLRARVQQFYDRLETQLKQILRDAEVREGLRPVITVSAAANLLLASAEGRICQYVRSEFKRRPTEYWEEQWQLLAQQLFKSVPASAGAESFA